MRRPRRIIAFIEQPAVIEKILTHLALWPGPAHNPSIQSPAAGVPDPKRDFCAMGFGTADNTSGIDYAPGFMRAAAIALAGE